jgi:flagellar hook-basal body complex protein FliE
MSLAALDPVIGASVAATAIAPQSSASTLSFESTLQSLQNLNARALADEQAVASLAVGQADNLHQIMIDMEQTRLGFELMLAVRTKLLDAYQELMRMQI